MKRGRGDNAKTVTVRISAPFEIFGRGRDPDGQAWGRFLRWRDPDGRPHEKFVADEALQGDASAVCAPLAAEGLEIVREQQRAFANYLSGAQPAGRVTVVQRTGWHEIEGENVFVLPGENIGRKRCRPRVARRRGAWAIRDERHAGRMARGRCHAGGGPRNSDARYIHCVRRAAVALGRARGRRPQSVRAIQPGQNDVPASGRERLGARRNAGIRSSMARDGNGLEGAAAQSTDTVMVLDELGMVDARDAAQAFYGLANGAGKQRAGRDGSPREPKSWRVLFLSSGELPVDAKLSETPGRKARAGQLVRLLDVPAERGAGFGVFDNGGPDGDAARSRNLSSWRRFRLTERPARHSCGD